MSSNVIVLLGLFFLLISSPEVAAVRELTESSTAEVAATKKLIGTSSEKTDQYAGPPQSYAYTPLPCYNYPHC